MFGGEVHALGVGPHGFKGLYLVVLVASYALVWHPTRAGLLGADA